MGCSPWGHTEQTPVRFPLVAASGGFSLVWGRGLLTAAPSLSQGTGSRPAGSAVAVQQLSCSTVCGISPDQGWDPRALHWQGGLGPSILRCLSFHPEIFLYYFFIIFFSPIPPPPPDMGISGWIPSFSFLSYFPICLSVQFSDVLINCPFF